MMVTELIRPCANENCCSTTLSNTTDMMLQLSTQTSTKGILSILSKTVAQELYSTVYQLPTSLFRLATDVWSHLKKEPKKPSWNMQVTIVMGFLQAFRDQSLTHSLEFWRLMLIAPTFATPLRAKIEQEIIQIPHDQQNEFYALCGILKKQHVSNKNHQLEAEWMTAVSAWERIYGGPSPINRNTNNVLMLEAPPSCEKIVLYFHGGAYVSMSAQTHRMLTYKISKVTKRRVLAVNYRLAPETKFPGQLYDAVQSYLYLIDPNGKHRFDPQNIVIMGDSAGGGLCLAMMLYIRDHGLPRPEGAVLLSPWVDLTFSYPSWKDASLYDYLPSNPGQLISMNPAQLYLNNLNLVTHPYVSPIFADNFNHLPPILIQSGGCESLRDEITDLTRKIKQSASTVIHHEIYEDMVHVFQAFPFEKSKEAIESIGWWTKYGIPLITQLKSTTTAEEAY